MINKWPFSFLSNLPDASKDEITEVILENDKIRVERIVSQGQKSPDGFYYDQNEDELIYLIKGAAKLHLIEANQSIHLIEGDFYYIPAHLKHRVEETDHKSKTIWLAVFFKR